VNDPATPIGSGNLRGTVLPRIEHVSGEGRLVVAEKTRYEAVRQLGAGGQAQVTLARDHDIDRMVAIKRLLPDRNDQASVLRFVEEIRAVGQLEHPNIVPIHDVGVDQEGQYFFVMKYVEGETLEHIIEQLRAGNQQYLKRYSAEHRLQICNEILRGIEHAHALGIVHRDLKPGNVMVGALGEVAITDWGLAKRMGEPDRAADAEPPVGDEGARLFQTHAGALLGTPAYMAPEQAAGKLDTLGVRSDIYSLAVMFYELLTLKHPRGHLTTVVEMIASVVSEPIAGGQIFFDFARAGVPAAAAHFVRHGLAHDPAERYGSVSEMRDRLGLVRDGRGPIECHVTFTNRVLSGVTRAANRHPIALGGVLAAIGVGALGGAVAGVMALLR
jgi:serine/threonine-protein kinase